MTRILIIGANGQLARHTTKVLLAQTDAHLTLFLRKANRLKNPDPSRAVIVEGDATENRHHYLNLLALWNGLAQRWENEWDYASPAAAIEFAAIVQANAFVLGEQGLVADLASIDFEMTPEDGEAIQAAILGALEG